MDNHQKSLNQAYENGETNEDDFDLHSALKYQLMDPRPAPSMTDDTPRNSVHSIARPLHVREYGIRTNLAPFMPEIFIGDRRPDCRGTENIPNIRLAAQIARDKSQWILNNLYKGDHLQTVGEQISWNQQVMNNQKQQKMQKEYLKVFGNELLGGNNQKYIYNKPNSLLGQQTTDQDVEDSKRGRIDRQIRQLKPQTVMNYNKVQSEDAGFEMVPRSEPDHIQQVGERSQIIYSNPQFDPVARRLGLVEQFKDGKAHANDQLSNKETALFIHKYKTMRQKARDPNATVEDRDKAREDFADQLKLMNKRAQKQVRVNFEDQEQDIDIVRQLTQAPRSGKYIVDKADPLRSQEYAERLDHLRDVYNNLEEADKNLVITAIRKTAKPSTDATIRLSIAEEMLELVTTNRQSRAQVQVLVDRFATEQDVSHALDTITERLVIKYRNMYPPRKAEAMISLIKQELRHTATEGYMNRAGNAEHLGNNSKTQQKALQYTQPIAQDIQDNKHTLQFSNKHLNREQQKSHTAHTRQIGSEQQIEGAQDRRGIRVNAANYSAKSAKQLKHFGSHQEEKIDQLVQ